MASNYFARRRFLLIPASFAKKKSEVTHLQSKQSYTSLLYFSYSRTHSLGVERNADNVVTTVRIRVCPLFQFLLLLLEKICGQTTLGLMPLIITSEAP